MQQINNILGQKINSFTVLQQTDKRVKRRVVWLVKCECGRKIQLPTNLIYKYKSCGCKRQPMAKERLWKGCGELSGTTWTSLKRGAKRRNLVFQVNIEYAWKLFLKQNKKCAISGETIKFRQVVSNIKEEETASFDRIDSSKGYIKDNVQWVHRIVNYMKQDMNEKDFIEWCRKISHNKKN